jgi:proline iminopeptidase
MGPKRTQVQRKALYPVPSVIAEGLLPVPLHRDGSSVQQCQLWFQVSGNPCGVPVVLFHGGPGYYTCPEDVQLWNPALFKIVCFDQRGCGKSTPPAYEGPVDMYQHITIDDIVEDAEHLRRRVLGPKERWLVCGYSWGSAVAVAYATKYGSYCVRGMLVQGVYCGRVSEHRGLFAPRVGHEEALTLFQGAVAELTNDAAAASGGSEDPLKFHEAVRDAVLSRGLGDVTVQRALAQWSLYENYFTYPDSREYFLKKMRAAAAAGPYAASRKDASGALMQLFLFPCMMRKDALGPEHQLSGRRVDPAIPVVVLQGEDDDICDASVARRLAKELSEAPKRPRGTVKFISSAASHDVLDGGAMQAAFLGATEALFDMTV